jgi:hypothetical protein
VREREREREREEERESEREKERERGECSRVAAVHKKAFWRVKHTTTGKIYPHRFGPSLFPFITFSLFNSHFSLSHFSHSLSLSLFLPLFTVNSWRYM